MSKHHITIHDNFIRAILSDKRIALDYFQNFLPTFVSNKLDFSSLTQIPDTYISEQLRKTMSDIVYTCLTKDGKEVKMSLLIEHKSFPDKYVPIQIGGYIFSALQKQIDNKELVSLIIPVLIYHGKVKWEYQDLLSLFQNLHPEWAKFVPNFDYIYNNLGEIPDEQVEALNNKFLTASILALKHSFQKNWLDANARKILVLSEDGSENLQKNLIVYLFGNSALAEARIIELLESLPQTLKETVMSTLDIFFEKGERIGIEKGERIGIEKGKGIGIEKGKQIGFDKALYKNTRTMLIKGFPLETICEALEVTPQYVTKIQAELNSEK